MGKHACGSLRRYGRRRTYPYPQPVPAQAHPSSSACSRMGSGSTAYKAKIAPPSAPVFRRTHARSDDGGMCYPTVWKRPDSFLIRRFCCCFAGLLSTSSLLKHVRLTMFTFGSGFEMCYPAMSSLRNAPGPDSCWAGRCFLD